MFAGEYKRRRIASSEILMNYIMDPESKLVSIAGPVAKTIIFKGGPQGGNSSRAHDRPDQGRGLLKRKPDTQSDSKKSESRLLNPVTPNAQSAVAGIYIYIYIYIDICI